MAKHNVGIYGTWIREFKMPFGIEFHFSNRAIFCTGVRGRWHNSKAAIMAGRFVILFY